MVPPRGVAPFLESGGSDFAAFRPLAHAWRGVRGVVHFPGSSRVDFCGFSGFRAKSVV
jgi:hypothetical protein